MITNVHNTYRKATSVEVRFYEEVLYPAQDLILSLCREYKYLYLTGGTALARFYLNHRLSEDLDFFIQVLDEDTDEVIEQQKKAEHYADDLAGKISRYFPVFARRSGDLYSKFYVKLEGFDLKIDFVREYNHTGNLLPLKSGGLLNNLDDLGTGKLMAFEDRSEIKDIIDLYYITQQIPLSRLFELAELKRIPIAYEKLLAINTQGISGKVLITQDLDPTALKNFIVLLKQETETVIKKKEDFAAKHINELISRQLWDFPREDRNLNPYSIPVLKRRLYQLPLPEKRALSAILY